jgi:hypothetical protein
LLLPVLLLFVSRLLAIRLLLSVWLLPRLLLAILLLLPGLLRRRALRIALPMDSPFVMRLSESNYLHV